MLTLHRDHSSLLVIDFQSRLMPAIESGDAVVANAKRLVQAAALFEIPVLLTEQNPRGLGPTVPELTQAGADVALKMTFDACRTSGFLDRPNSGTSGPVKLLFLRVSLFPGPRALPF